MKPKIYLVERISWDDYDNHPTRAPRFVRLLGYVGSRAHAEAIVRRETENAKRSGWAGGEHYPQFNIIEVLPL